MEAENYILSLADDMAQAATNFKGQGYTSFLTAREALKSEIHNIINRKPDDDSELMPS